MKTMCLVLLLACNAYAKDAEQLHPGMYTVNQKYALLEATARLFYRIQSQESTKMAIVKTNSMIRKAYGNNPPIIVKGQQGTDSVLFIFAGLGVFRVSGNHGGSGGKHGDKFFNYNGDPPPPWLGMLFIFLLGLVFWIVAIHWNWQIAIGLIMFVFIGVYIIAKIVARL